MPQIVPVQVTERMTARKSPLPVAGAAHRAMDVEACALAQQTR
jgi:hypothetical protein